MPKPAIEIPSEGTHLVDYVRMKSPTGEIRTVKADAAAITPLMINGWAQVFEEETK